MHTTNPLFLSCSSSQLSQLVQCFCNCRQGILHTTNPPFPFYLQHRFSPVTASQVILQQETRNWIYHDTNPFLPSALSYLHISSISSPLSSRSPIFPVPLSPMHLAHSSLCCVLPVLLSNCLLLFLLFPPVEQVPIDLCFIGSRVCWSTLLNLTLYLT